MTAGTLDDQNLIERGDAPVARATSPLWKIAFATLLVIGGTGAIAALLLADLRAPEAAAEDEDRRPRLRFDPAELELPAFPQPEAPAPVHSGAPAWAGTSTTTTGSGSASRRRAHPGGHPRPGAQPGARDHPDGPQARHRDRRPAGGIGMLKRPTPAIRWTIGLSIPLGRHRGKLRAFNGDLHPFLAAATGTGKGVGFVVPNLLHWQGSVICLDILRFCHEPEKPRGSMKSALATKLTLWANPLIDRATSRTDFDLRRFRREPMSLYIAIAPDDLQRLGPLVRLLIEFFLASNSKAGETPADDPTLNVPALLLLDEFLSLGRMDKLVHALSCVRGWGIRIATVIQSEARLHAVYGRELAEAFIDNHRARVYYRPPVHRRDVAEAISKIIGQKTVKQTSFSYADKLFAGGRSRQVSKTGQAILDADEIANLRNHETIVLVEGLRPLVGQKLRWYRDRTFKRRGLAALPLPAPLLAGLPDAPRVTIRRDDDESEDAGGTVAPASPPRPRATTPPRRCSRPWTQSRSRAAIPRRRS